MPRPPLGKKSATFGTALNQRNNDVENRPESSTATLSHPQAGPSKSRLSSVYSYTRFKPSPAVVYTRDEEEANEMVRVMPGPLGFDLEWVVHFRRGKAPRENRTALLQLSSERIILLVQLSAMKRFPRGVKAVIEDKHRIKLGANIKNDGHKLYRDYGVRAAGLVELGTFARHTDPAFPFNRSIVALAKIVKQYTHKTLSKGPVRTSNWEAQPLSQEQRQYAANDAHCALVVYKCLVAIAEEHGRTVDVDATILHHFSL
ncbi:ribonuclease H-like domain-containing protein [Epithele typhae]|uniref:ribonuclease H-like domain-containing protein n=1 Tax=Epithele typhae TaxID=378194 RepID=UPI0020083D6E|nr:ribonuclease H-like domain-containing protein [Epithele typhae]KAH9915179.1 ribonuclease H-like domain-containing protein [Epithele typhae]